MTVDQERVRERPGSPERQYDEAAALAGGIETALDGYARDSEVWEYAKEVFQAALVEGERADDALNRALEVAQEGAESDPQEAAKRFWAALPTGEAIEDALDGYANSAESWRLSRWLFEDLVEEGAPIEKALETALSASADESETTPARATLKFWNKIQPSYVEEWLNRPMNNLEDGIILGRRIHVPKDKIEGAGTYIGDQDGNPVIVKHGEKQYLDRERRILSSVDHKGIPRVTSYLEDVEAIDGMTRLAMEQLPGKSLDTILTGDKSVPLSGKRVIGIGLGLIGDFKALSDAGYLYRDLSPAHVILDETKNELSVGLVDVESALKKDEEGKATIHQPRGTWETMSPEEFDMGGVMTEASNVYSIGSLMLYMATGEKPFAVPEGETQEEIDGLFTLTRELHERGPELHIVGPLGEVIDKALDPDPLKRYQTLDEFAAAIRAAA